LFLCALALPGIAQQNAPGQPPRRPEIAPPPGDEDEARTRITNEMAKKAAKERVASLKTDTDRLLKLSVELKQYVDKSDENVLSVDVIKKAEAIEKLARSVKDKMKGPN
jgi:hypothetical protein